MHSNYESAVYLRSEWIDAATGAPLEEFLTHAELHDILCALERALEYDEAEANAQRVLNGYHKLVYFSERHELGDD